MQLTQTTSHKTQPLDCICTDADASTVLEKLVECGELDDERVDLMLRLAAETRIRARMKQEAEGAQ